MEVEGWIRYFLGPLSTGIRRITRVSIQFAHETRTVIRLDIKAVATGLVYLAHRSNTIKALVPNRGNAAFRIGFWMPRHDHVTLDRRIFHIAHPCVKEKSSP